MAPCTRGQKTREGAASAVRHRHIGTIIDIAVKLVKPKSFFDADKRPGEKCGLGPTLSPGRRSEKWKDDPQAYS